MTTRIHRRARAATWRLWGSFVLVVLVAGCVSFPKKTTSTSGAKGSIRRDTSVPLGKIHPNVLAAEVARFADEATALVSQAADSFATQVGTPQARATALHWKTGAANSSMIIATGGNPTANLLDMVVWVSLQRLAFEDYWLPKYGKPVEPILAVTRELDQEIWEVAARVLTPKQLQELRDLIQEWREKHPEQIYINVQFRDFAEIAAKDTSGLNAKPGSLFSLTFLDPFSGLDPTTRELAQTRFFAERALYVIERMPKLLRWQSELVIAQTLAAPEVQQIVSNSTQFSQSAQQLTQAVQKFPEQIAVEREQIVKELSRQTPEWQALSAQFQQTFRAGSEMAGSVDAAVKSLDAFIQRVAPPAPAPSAAGVTDTNIVAAAGGPAGKHFDVTEYGAAAAEIGKAAQQLDTLTHSLEKTTPEINAVVKHTGLQGKELVDYAFRKAMWFVGLALIGVVVAMVTYRWFASRLSRPLPPDSTGKK